MNKIRCFLFGIFTGIICKSIVEPKLINLMKLESKENEDKKKFRSYYYMLNQWIEIGQNGKKIEDLFLERNYHNIAIYGMGETGKRLYYELIKTRVKVKFVLDKQLEGKIVEFPLIADKNSFKEIDAIIVSIPFAYEEIKKEMSKTTTKPVVSLEHILFEV